MRIVHVVLSLGLGGQEMLILELSRVARARGHDVRLVSLTEGGALRGEFGDIPVTDVRRRPGVDPRLILDLARHFRRISPDVVHTHNSSPLIYGAPAARLARVPRAIHTKHGVNSARRGSILLEGAAARLTSAFVAVSEETAAVARDRERVPAHLLRTIQNGIPLGRFAPDAERGARARAELGLPPGAFVVGTIGRLVPEKHYALLIEAMRPLVGEGVRLVIVGAGPEEAELRAAAAGLEGHVIFTGARRDVPDMLAAFDVFALSSRTEGLPLAVVEAMAAGLPVVATAVGGLPTTVPKNAGFLVPPGDARALREAIQALHQDRATRESMGRAGRTSALERFSIERVADAYEKLYGVVPTGA